MNNEIEKLVERLNEAYDKIEKLEYRVVELENKIKYECVLKTQQ